MEVLAQPTLLQESAHFWSGKDFLRYFACLLRLYQ
jgi:hypothetical protein